MKSNILFIIDITISCILIIGTNYFLMDISSELVQYLPKNFISVTITFLSTIAGSIYLYIRYSFNLFHVGFGNTNDVNRNIIWGIIGGLLIAVINFPNKYTFNSEIVKNITIDPNHGIFIFFIFLIVVVIMIPVTDELFFRGFIFRLFKDKINPYWGYIVSTGLFAIAHKFSIRSIFSSIIICYLYDKTGFIGPCIISHIIWNLVWFSVIYIYIAGGN